jgi:predicted AAA+ superfamily ATPase
MYRKAIKDLVRWKNSKNRKPLMVYGARQVGKTWLLKEFGAQKYAQVAYIMMANNPRMKALFENNSDAASIISGLEIEAGFSFDHEDTLIILDEAQEVPKSISALKYIFEQTPEYHVVVAGSLLGLTVGQDISFPVGKVNSLHIYPLDFEEFLCAVKSRKFAEILDGSDDASQVAFHDELNELLKQYFIIGGMPEVVKSFASNGDYFDARDIQKQIISDYEHDFGKHAPNNIVPRIQMVLSSIPSQLAKENKKFLYGTLKTGARAKDYELAIQWLVDAGILYKVPRVSALKVPLKHYEDLSAFKLFLVDVGLLSAMSGVEPRTILEKNNVFTEYRGAMTEQYVAEQLIATGIYTYYFSSDDTKSEVDFVISNDDSLIPIEVKSSENLASKSLKYLVEKYVVSSAIKFSLLPEKKNPIIHNLPLYSVVKLRKLLGKSVIDGEA